MDARLGFRNRGLHLIFAGSGLHIIHYRDDVSGLHGVAFAEANLSDAATHFWRNGGIVAFYAAAQNYQIRGNGRLLDVVLPDEIATASQQQHQQQANRRPPFLRRRCAYSLFTHNLRFPELSSAMLRPAARIPASEKSAMCLAICFICSGVIFMAGHRIPITGRAAAKCTTWPMIP